MHLASNNPETVFCATSSEKPKAMLIIVWVSFFSPLLLIDLWLIRLIRLIRPATKQSVHQQIFWADVHT